MVTGPIPRKPKATKPKAKMGAAKRNFAGMMDSKAAWVETCQAANISTMMTKPIQNADILPATKPDRMLRDAPPCLEQLVTSRTWRELVLTNTFVNSGIKAPATVPQLIITDRTHQRAGCAAPVASLKSPSSTLLAMKVITIDTAEVIQTKCVKGASKSKSFFEPNMALLMPSFTK